MQEVDAQRPPPDSQINAQIKSGPVTQFEELSERGLVCRTVVDTLTAKMGLKTMTQVQSMTINETLKGIDVYANPTVFCWPVSNSSLVSLKLGQAQVKL